MTTINKNFIFSQKNLRKLKMTGKQIGIMVYCIVASILIIISFIYLYKKLKEF